MDKFDKYDFVELVIFDVHCVPKGRLVTKHRMADVLKHGMGIYGGICWFGIQEQPTSHEDFCSLSNFGNQLLWPLPETLTDVLPSARGNHKVGQVICTLKAFDGSLDMSTPRVLAEKQLESLSAMGFSIRSSIEQEFAIYYADTLKPFGHEKKWHNMRVISQKEGILLDFIQELKAIGINADTLQTEDSIGQYEMTFDVTEGIQVADINVRFKSAASIFFEKHGMKAIFMSKFDLHGLCNCHNFNHSLWGNDSQNCFKDSDNPGALSAIGCHWLAGLIAHTRALTALCCPTVNCYRHLFNSLCPSVANWGKDNRQATYRLKAEHNDNVYLENRLPGSASNPYLVLAGVVAAGIDGIKRKLPLEDAKCDRELPRSLEEALTALEEDDYMVEALGKRFVKHFVYVKRTYELDPLKERLSGGGLTDHQIFELERDLYFNYC